MMTMPQQIKWFKPKPMFLFVFFGVGIFRSFLTVFITLLLLLIITTTDTIINIVHDEYELHKTINK